MKHWKILCKEWIGCQACRIGQLAENHVFGAGFIPADVLLVGEAPGKSEDALGEPFIGPAGRLLDEALDKSGLGVRRLFKTNLVACRPTNELSGPNRQPSQREIENCSPRLERTIEITKPAKIIALGKIPSERLDFLGIVCVRMAHPAYILRNGGVKAEIFTNYVKGFQRVYENVTV